MSENTITLFFDPSTNQWMADYAHASPMSRDAAMRLYRSYQLPLGYDGRTSPERMLEVMQRSPLSATNEYVLR